MRFNLQIEHVHKGILLGTGPLINPGFCGRLMIPMHNLTTNDYVLKCGDPLIGVEFTKLSKNDNWAIGGDHIAHQHGKYIKNHGLKDNKKFLDYIDKHVPRGKIVKSSLSGTLDKADRSARRAESLQRKIFSWSILGGLTLVISLGGLSYQVYSLVNDSTNYVSTSNDRIVQLENANKELKKELSELMNKFESLKRELSERKAIKK